MNTNLITIALAIFSLNVYGFSYTCTCELEFKKKETGELYTEEVSVDCPKADNSSDLDCDGDEFGGTLTATCSNEDGDSESNSGWTQWDAEPTSPWASCSI